MNYLEKLHQAGYLHIERDNYYGFATFVEPVGDDLVHLHNPVMVALDEGHWFVAHWTYCPGPGEDDFYHKCKDLNEAIELAYAFYFGEPTFIDDWIVLLHRHPELALDAVQQAVQNAAVISAAEFESIREQCILVLGSTRIGWPNALKWQFIEISHQHNSHLRLQLRRDGQEAFIIIAE